MAQFSYTARKADGGKVSGVEDGETSRAVVSSLRAAGLTPIEITEVKATAATASKRKRKSGGGAPKLDDVAHFARQLSTLLGAGVGLVNALGDIAGQVEKPRFAEILEDALNRVIGGSTLSSALREHPRVFSPLVCAMTRAGEESGRLDSILGDLATYLEKQVALRRKVRSAMTYPTVIFAFFCCAVAFLFLWLLPKFQNLFHSLKGDLPLVTEYALAFSAWARAWFPLLAAAGLALGVGFLFARRAEGVRLWLDRAKLRAPVIGELFLKVSMVRFLETLATLQRSGVPILTSLEMAGETVGNRHIERELELAGRQVAQGTYLSTQLAKSGTFPRMMVRMMAVGEETGRVEELLNRAAKYYEDEVDATVQSVTSLIEPVVIVLMGVVVAFVVVSVYFPIFKMAGSVR